MNVVQISRYFHFFPPAELNFVCQSKRIDFECFVMVFPRDQKLTAREANFMNVSIVQSTVIINIYGFLI